MTNVIRNNKKSILQIDFKKVKFIFVVTFILGLIAHAYCFFNANFSHDSLDHLITLNNIESYLQKGRFLRPVYQALKCYWALPWLK